MRTLSKIIYPVNTKFGAPMGRSNVGEFPPTVTSGPNNRILKKNNIKNKVFDSAVPMNGAYDRGGAYWGFGSSQLRVRYTKDLTFIQFYRK